MMQMNRRQFVTFAAATCAGCLCGSRPVFAAEEALIDAGPLSDYPRDGIYTNLAEEYGFILIRRKTRLYAVSSLCSHKGYGLVPDREEAFQLKCEKHGSLFSIEGDVAKGPATKALPRYGIRLNAENHVVVDLAQYLEDKKQWTKAGAYVVVPEAKKQPQE